MKNLTHRVLLQSSAFTIFALSIQNIYAADYIEWANTKIITWYELVISALITRGTALFSQIQDRLAPFINWYDTNNITVGVIPWLMFVPIIDFTLVSLGIFLFGWMVLKWLS